MVPPQQLDKEAGQPLTGHIGPVWPVAFGVGADGRLLLASAGGDDGTVRLWDPATGTRSRCYVAGPLCAPWPLLVKW